MYHFRFVLYTPESACYVNTVSLLAQSLNDGWTKIDSQFFLSNEVVAVTS